MEENNFDIVTKPELIREDIEIKEQKLQERTLGSDLLELLFILTKWRRFIIRFVVGVTIITILYTMTLPKMYKATASVFTADQITLFPGVGGFSGLYKVNWDKGLVRFESFETEYSSFV